MLLGGALIGLGLALGVVGLTPLRWFDLNHLTQALLRLGIAFAGLVLAPAIISSKAGYLGAVIFFGTLMMFVGKSLKGSELAKTD